MTQQRRILWNKEYNFQGENITRWYFLIVNAKREIKYIRNRIYEHLSMVDNIEELASGSIPNIKGINYNLFRLDSERSEIENLRLIYDGKWKRERSLYTRETDISLLNIIEREGLA